MTYIVLSGILVCAHQQSIKKNFSQNNLIIVINACLKPGMAVSAGRRRQQLWSVSVPISVFLIW